MNTDKANGLWSLNPTERKVIVQVEDRQAADNEPQAQHSPSLPQGTPVMCNGYRGAIIRHYDGTMYKIRLDRGSVCTDNFTVIEV